MKASIIVNGDREDLDIIKNECDSSDYIICADGGSKYARKLNIIPDYIIGDLDSIDKNDLEFFKDNGVIIEKYPPEKDFTDTELCIQKAFELGCSEIAILAAAGERLDHTMGNIWLLYYILEKGLKGYIASKQGYIYITDNKINISGNKGDTLSVLPLTKKASGLYTSNLKYGLFDSTIELGRSIGISNVMMSDECSIEVKDGIILIIKPEKEKI